MSERFYLFSSSFAALNDFRYVYAYVTILVNVSQLYAMYVKIHHILKINTANKSLNPVSIIFSLNFL